MDSLKHPPDPPFPAEARILPAVGVSAAEDPQLSPLLEVTRPMELVSPKVTDPSPCVPSYK